MSLSVKHLTADTTFLLTLSPDPVDQIQKPNRTFTILLDPWLHGPAIVGASWFASTTHGHTPPSINHLSEIPAPDMVIVSANHSDHCNRNTLCQLNPHAHTMIVAEPAAATSIRAYRHFDPARIYPLQKYNADNPNSLLRVRIPPLAPSGRPGQVTIAFIPAKNYLTGLHNAIGITYEPPTGSRVASTASSKSIELPIQHFPKYPDSVTPSRKLSVRTHQTTMSSTSSLDLPFLPIQKPPPVWRKSASLQQQENTVRFDLPAMTPTPPDSPPLTGSTLAHGSDASRRHSRRMPSLDNNITSGITTAMNQTAPLYPSLHDGLTTAINATPRLPSITPSEAGFDGASDSYSHDNLYSPSPTIALPSPSPLLLLDHETTTGTTRERAKADKEPRSKPISILYSPHGFHHPVSPDPSSFLTPLPTSSPLTPYVLHHLAPLKALPLTLLLHSFDRISNPWFLGGTISCGAEQGVLVARALAAKCWIGAHDEEKVDRGCSVAWMRKRRMGVAEVRRLVGCFGGGGLAFGGEVKQDERDRHGGGREWWCDVRVLEAGGELFLEAG